MFISLVLLVAGIALVLWGAERFTDGAVSTATRYGLSTFYVGTVVSGSSLRTLLRAVLPPSETCPKSLSERS